MSAEITKSGTITTTGEGSPQAWHINSDQTLGKAVIMVEEEAVTIEKFALGRIEIYQGEDMISLDARQAAHAVAALLRMVTDTEQAEKKARSFAAKAALATAGGAR